MAKAPAAEEFAQMQKRLLQLEDLLQQKDEENKNREAKIRADERNTNTRIRAGKFFAPISKIWQPEPEQMRQRDAKDGKSFNAIRRDPGHYIKIANYKPIGDLTMNHNLNPNFDHKQKKALARRVSGSSNSSAGTGNRSAGTGNRSAGSRTASSGHGSRRSVGSFQKYTIAGKVSSSKAQLIPEEQPCQRVHGVMGQAVCGLYPEELPNTYLDKDEQIIASQQLVCGLKDSIVTAYGLVDMDENFIQMPPNHGPMYDEHPCWMVVPILQQDEVKNWTGVDGNGNKKGFWVMAVAGGHGKFSDEAAYMPFIDLGYNDGVGVERLPGELERKQCEPQDIRDATELLRPMVKAMAETLVGRDGKISPLDLFRIIENKQKKAPTPAPALSSNDQQKKRDLEFVRENIIERGILLPDLSRGYTNQKVMKIYLDPELTTVPDPMLLLIKAAISWSARQEQKLLPACGSEERLSNVPNVVECIPQFVEDDYDDDEDDYDDDYDDDYEDYY